MIGVEKEQPSGNLGICYRSLGDYRKSIEYHGKHLKIAIEMGDRGGVGGAHLEISVFVTGHWVTIENPLSTMRNI